jgi:hypothetical protein
MGKGHLLLEHQIPDPQVSGLIDVWLAKQLKAGDTTTAPSGAH